MKNPEIQLPAVCSISKMADMLGLSRQRLYQLIDTEVFPPPVFDIDTRRPFYTQDLQQKCILIRESGIGFNGQTVLFNQPRKRGKTQDHSNPQIDKYVQALKGMGCRVNAKKVRGTISELYPKGADGRPDEIVIRDLARYLSQGTMPDV